LLQEWDEIYYSDDWPKSDLVVRTTERVFGWHFAKEVRLGWNLNPLPADWKPVTRLAVKELALKIKAELARKK
jgi:hypothetical protein